jgi:hypothetical protein
LDRRIASADRETIAATAILNGSAAEKSLTYLGFDFGWGL